MTKNEVLENIILKVLELGTSIEYGGLIYGERLHTLKKEEANIISNLLGEMINEINGTVFKIGEVERPEKEIERALYQAYQYTFDKTIEITYSIRSGIDRGFEWDSDDMFNSMSGDNIPEYLQLKITPLIPNIAKIYNEIYSYSKNLIEQSNSRTVFDGILFSSVQLATEVGLRLDYENTSEWDKLMDL